MEGTLMFTRSFLITTILFSTIFSFAAHASCSDCAATSDMIVFGAANPAPEDDVFLAWNFKNAFDADYPRMLRDSEYSMVLFESYSESVTNYLVDRNFKVLVEIPTITDNHYDAVFGAEGLSPNHRDANFSNDRAQGFVFFSLDYKWYTAKLFLYKRVVKNGVLSLKLVPGFDIGVVNEWYRRYLTKNFSEDATYIRDREELVLNYMYEQSNTVGCKEAGADFCFDSEIFSYVPKEPLPDNFSNDMQRHLAVKLDSSGYAHMWALN
jgi:hypothetical protein